MAYNEALTLRLREAFADALEGDPRPVVEKRMFRGVLFLVDGKMTASAGDDRFMFRIDPAMHQTALDGNGVSPVIMQGRSYKGYVHVREDAVRTKRELLKWVERAVDYNPRAKASVKRKKK